MSSRILLVEDEPGLVMTVTDLLESEGHEVTSRTDGQSGLDTAVKNDFDLLILDVMLPKKTGFDLLRDLRQHGKDAPVLMLTAKSQVVDKVVGLKLGADDYLTKPFDPSELLARIEALLRRTKKENRAAVKTYSFGNVSIDFERGEVRKAGHPVQMASKELLLLRYLVDQRGRVIPREELLERVWEYQSEVNSRTIDVHIAWLRQKLEDIPQSPAFIHTIRGKGYRFAD